MSHSKPNHVQPNAHPYAIKTTSTALLSRSSSSPHTAHHTRHHYIPLTPTRARERHRHSSSLSSVEGEASNGVHLAPDPLPVPPDSTPVPFKRANEPKFTQRTRRAGTLPSSATAPTATMHRLDRQKHVHTRDHEHPGFLYASLPPNPKQWNPDELMTYIGTLLRSDDDSDLVDILECVRARNLTGRELLRLTGTDLADTSLSDVQRTQLLACSRTLRAEVLRGRIYADSYHYHEISDNSNDVYSKFAGPLTPLGSIRNASISVDNIHSLLDNRADEDECIFPPSPALTLHRSNSVSDASAERYRDLARMRMRRRGRVKGLVETWERTSGSGSECSAEEGSVCTSDVGSESESDLEFRPTLDNECSTESRSDPLSAKTDRIKNDSTPPIADPAPVDQGASAAAPFPPYNRTCPNNAAEDVDEEPTIEELLASSSGIPLTGARAWEADFGLGETVKRIPTGASPDPGRSPSLVSEPDLSHHSNKDQQISDGSVQPDGLRLRTGTGIGSRSKHTVAQRRVITAIFTGSAVDGNSIPVKQGDNHDHHTCDTADGGASSRGTNSDLRGQNGSDSGLRALEESIASTRTQVDAFRVRLEELEADMARQEAMSAQARSSQHSSTTRTRRRRSETTDVTETVKQPRHRDALEDWETLSLADIARAIIAKAMGWVFPYGHVGAHSPTEERDSRPHRSAGGKITDGPSSPVNVKGSGGVLVRSSCSIVLISFALCAALLRRVGFGRWIRKP